MATRAIPRVRASRTLLSGVAVAACDSWPAHTINTSAMRSRPFVQFICYNFDYGKWNGVVA